MTPIVLPPEDAVSGSSDFALKQPSKRLVVGPHCLFTYNSLTLNDRRELEGYFVEDVGGFDDADLRTSDQERPQDDGSMVGPGYYGSRVMTLGGFIQAGTYPRLLEMQADLSDALLDLVERPLVISVLPDGYFAQPEVQIYCRKADKLLLSKKIEQRDLNGPLQKGFTIALKATDPVLRSTLVYNESLVPTVVSALGRSYDRSYDLAYDIYMDENFDPVPTGGSANSMTVNNQGNWPALPTLRFNGFMSGAKLTNNANGHRVVLTQPILDGDYIDVNIYTGRVVDSAGVNRSDYLSTTSDWMRLVGDRGSYDGQNNLSLQVTDFGANGSVVIAWQDSFFSA